MSSRSVGKLCPPLPERTRPFIFMQVNLLIMQMCLISFALILDSGVAEDGRHALMIATHHNSSKSFSLRW